MSNKLGMKGYLLVLVAVAIAGALVLVGGAISPSSAFADTTNDNEKSEYNGKDKMGSGGDGEEDGNEDKVGDGEEDGDGNEDKVGEGEEDDKDKENKVGKGEEHDKFTGHKVGEGEQEDKDKEDKVGEGEQDDKHTEQPARLEPNDKYDPKLLLRAIKPRTNLLPNARGIRVRWDPLTHSNHDSIAPTGRQHILPDGFLLQRRSTKDGQNFEDYKNIASIGNDTDASKLKVIDNELTPREMYQYRIIVLYENDHEVPLRPMRLTDPVTFADLNLREEVREVANGVRVHWTPVRSSLEGAHYNVERRGWDEAVWTDIAGMIEHNFAVNRLHVTDTDIDPGSKYTYLITLRDMDDNVIGFADELSIEVAPDMSMQTSNDANLETSSVSLTDLDLMQEAVQVAAGVSVSWLPVPKLEIDAHYRVERRAEAESSWTVVADMIAHSLDGSRLQITDTDVIAGSKYTYLITVRDSGGNEIGNAAELSVGIVELSEETAPELSLQAPSNEYLETGSAPLTDLDLMQEAVQVSAGVSVSWLPDARLESAAHYRVERRAEIESSWTVVADVVAQSPDGNRLQITDTAVTAGSYTYRVTVRDGAGNVIRDGAGNEIGISNEMTVRVQ